jgi:sugar phosphate isomerase/epimerase
LARTVSLHQFTVIDLPPLAFAELAGKVGCERVCVFSHWPAGMPRELPAITRAVKDEFLARLADNGIRVIGADFFPITPDLDPDSFKGPLAYARELGVRHVTTAVWDEDAARAADKLGAVADLAAAEGLKATIEFMGTTPACDTLKKAVWYVDQVGRPNLGITLDAVHLVRSGATAAEIAALDPRYINNAQICDGYGLQVTTDYMHEAAVERITPGEGDWPLVDIFRAIPADVLVDLELPTTKVSGDGPDTVRFVKNALEKSQAILAEAGGR